MFEYIEKSHTRFKSLSFFAGLLILAFAHCGIAKTSLTLNPFGSRPIEQSKVREC
jgi:hypothetical protein